MLETESRTRVIAATSSLLLLFPRRVFEQLGAKGDDGLGEIHRFLAALTVEQVLAERVEPLPHLVDVGRRFRAAGFLANEDEEPLDEGLEGARTPILLESQAEHFAAGVLAEHGGSH